MKNDNVKLKDLEILIFVFYILNLSVSEYD